MSPAYWFALCYGLGLLCILAVVLGSEALDWLHSRWRRRRFTDRPSRYFEPRRRT